MTKKIMTFFSILLIASISLCVSALAKSKLSGHWAEKLVDEKFIEKHFENLVENDFKKFDPDEDITAQDFKQALNSVLKECGYLVGTGEEDLDDDIILRKEAAVMIADELLENNIVQEKQKLINPFKDLKDLDKEQVEKILLLNNLGILKGVSETLFLPEGKVTQIQAIIMLQRVRDFIIETFQKDIPFKVIDESKSYSSVEAGITVEEGEDTVLVSVVEKFPNPGYSMKVDKIKRQGNIYKILLDVEEPDPDKVYSQVITYNNIILEISKDDLGKPPYFFKMEGAKFFEEDISLGDDWKIDPEKVKTIELFSPEGNKIKTFKESEIDNIVKSFNESKVDNRAYIMKITGNSMLIETKDFRIRIISYGSDTNIVASKEENGTYTTKHLICPKIAELLLKE